MTKRIFLENKVVGPESPIYLIGEIGINHNGDLTTAKKLIDIAADAGFDAVKFQKRTPELCVPVEQRDILRETPWGVMTYLDYRYKVEFGYDEYLEIDKHCKSRGIHWFASCWDVDAVDFMEQFKPVCYKLASASITDIELLEKHRKTERPIIMSTGMSTMDEIRNAVDVLGKERLLIAHSTSTYPCPHNQINLAMIHSLQDEFGVPVGYSGHEIGLQISVAAAAMGACFIERHITLDRAMWGSDQSASLEPKGIELLARDIRIVEEARGTGIKEVYESEMSARARLRKSK